MEQHSTVWALALAVALSSSLGAQVGQSTLPVLEFSGKTLGGRALDQDRLKDHVVIIDLWGTWCGPCRQVVPILTKLYAKYKQYGLEIVGFSYSADGSPEAADTVRAFAAENHITYDLLPGDPKVRDVHPFRGYPTMLLYRRGLAFDTVHTGFADDLEKNLDKWVRESLGLDAAPAKPVAAEVKEEVPRGKIFEPGNGDQGFELECEDIRGVMYAFSSSGGKPTLIALTTSWDENAARTAQVLQSLRGDAPSVEILAWHLERAVELEKKIAAAREFADREKVDYRVITTGLEVAMNKVHRFAALPTFLLFDASGALVAREGGLSDDTLRRLREALTKLKPLNR